MRKLRCEEEKIFGLWRDSTGKDYEISFKKKWGSHEFSDNEIEALLEGKEVCFGYNNRQITGHLQWKHYENNKYFGFCPAFDKEYTEKPILGEVHQSMFQSDKKKEKLMNEFMLAHYYSKLSNLDGTSIQVEIIGDKEMQKQGVDVVYTRDSRKYIVDEKAQIDYITNPIPTFALEILNSASGKVGWFINDELKTEYYMFIWPKAEQRNIQKIDDIKYADYALVEKKRLVDEVEAMQITSDKLLAYARSLAEEKLDGAYEKNNRLYYKEPPFDEGIYLVYTKPPQGDVDGKVERPVNLVVIKSALERWAEEFGTLPKKDLYK